MESTADFIRGSSHILPITRKSKFSIYSTLASFVDYCNYRVLLATIRNLGSCPCPRCLIPKQRIPEIGVKRDDTNRKSTQRTAKESGLGFWITLVRDLIYKMGKGVKSAFVERILAPESLAPTAVRSSTIFICSAIYFTLLKP